MTFAAEPRHREGITAGHAHYGAFTAGGPVVIPGLVNGRNKLFFFGNYQQNLDDTAARNTPTSRVPANQAELNGDFSDLLTLPSPAQYIIYDPLTVRPDPARPGSFIRDPFPGNIIPKDRFMNADGTYKNPLFALFKDMMPPPNQNFVEQGAIPDANYYQGATPNLTTAKNYGGRLDYNLSANDRIFFRYAGTQFHEQLGDWTYETLIKGLHTNDKTRYSWAYTGSWTKVLGGGLVIDSSLSTNRFHEDQQRIAAHGYKPSDVGLPSYLDAFCTAANNCMMPVINVTGLPVDWAHGRRRPPIHQLPGTEHRHQREGLPHDPLRHRCSPGEIRERAVDRRQREFHVYVRQHLHARGGYHLGVPEQQHRHQHRGPHARASDAGDHRDERAAVDQQPVLWDVLPGQLAHDART